ncbi:hypothetical protein MKX01_039878 [Papaver californicum]|nr:hypothetical protein MKX01_039878 [Papaver californicum]
MDSKAVNTTGYVAVAAAAAAIEASQPQGQSTYKLLNSDAENGAAETSNLPDTEMNDSEDSSLDEEE